jgi:hypothetical protein
VHQVWHCTRRLPSCYSAAVTVCCDSTLTGLFVCQVNPRTQLLVRDRSAQGGAPKGFFATDAPVYYGAQRSTMTRPTLGQGAASLFQGTNTRDGAMH